MVEAEVAEEEGKEEGVEEVVLEVEGLGDGHTGRPSSSFLFFPLLSSSQNVADPEHRVWLGLSHDEQLVWQLAWLL